MIIITCCAKWLRRFANLILGLGVLCNTATAIAVPTPLYTFTLIAESEVGGSFGEPSINEHGVVSFYSRGDDAFVIGEADNLTFVPNPFTENGDEFNKQPTINDNGEIAIFGKPRNEQRGIYASDGSPFELIATGGSQFVSSSFVPFNNDGEAAFMGGTLLRGHGDTFTYIAGVNDVENDFSSFVVDRLSISDNGIVAFVARHSDDSWTLFTGDGSAPERIAGETEGFFVVSQPSVNNDGDVLFTARTAQLGSTGLYLARDGVITRHILLDTLSPFETFGSPSMNSRGDIVFSGTPVGETGNFIFDGTDPVANRIVGDGDVLPFGDSERTVVGVEFYPTGFNDAGQVAFRVSFSSYQRTGIYVATRVVPEPSGLLLVLMGVVVLSGWRKLREPFLRRQQRTRASASAG